MNRYEQRKQKRLMDPKIAEGYREMVFGSEPRTGSVQGTSQRGKPQRGELKQRERGK